jgi:hypothetical protein
VADVHYLDARDRGEVSQIGPAGLDEPAVEQIPPDHGHPSMSQPGKHHGRLGHRRGGYPAETDENERGLGPLRNEAGGLVGVRVGIGVGGASGDHEEGKSSPAGGQHGVAEHSHQGTRDTERRSQDELDTGVALAGFHNHGGHVTLGMPRPEQHQR